MISTKWIFIRWFFKYLSPIIGIFEKHAVKKHASQGTKYSPVFVIGTPRSGSTVLYQLITHYLDMLYVNNFINLAREAPFIGFLFNQCLFNRKQHNSFNSKYGNTTKDGLIAPNEGLFWYKWLPKDRHFVLESELTEKQKQDFKDSFNAIMNKYRKPLLIKNLSFSLRLKLIKELFPKAKIIYLKRDNIEAIQSVINAKISIYGKINNNWWSLKPPNYKKLLELQPIEQVVKQIYYIEKQIYNDLKLFDKRNILEIHYDDLNDYEKIIDQIKELVGCDYLKASKLVPKIDIVKKKKVSDKIYNEILYEINKLDWENYLS